MTKLVERWHHKGDAASSAVYSPCGSYRYALTRIWQSDGPRLLYILLNPSKATEEQNDPTVERCERRARAWGYGGFRVCNIFAYRATDPRDLKRAETPIGDANTLQLEAACTWSDLILCGWGTHGAHMGQGPKIESHLRAVGHALHHLGLSQQGHPRHPLYIAYSVKPQPWTA